ncbi:dihydroxyacetone kinase subunit DhaL [Hydrogenoanaerobacterium sp.]|uniref:dihydroxyacetone kinase subunit DhaL n=1 Tax=Hydrogenoanaerobacterium sp. TaxID=2953763 RepID=UPI00289FCA13|nr:dihydroxyacetone kinase subunit DhaL [Hydrogenoanaerobacterium sp.]
MGFQLTSKDYTEYIKLAYAKIHENGDYVTALDSATGDGDHWSNINMGFESLVEAIPELEAMNVFDAFKKIGMIMMSVIGGSGGVLYGSAYMEAAKTLKGKDVIENQDMCDVLEAMLNGVMARGNAKPGFKTMIDALHPAVECYKDCIAKGISEKETLELVKKAALDGAQSTADMEAVRGRACYQANKGVGHLDPGAVTMSYQIEILMDYIATKL